MADFYTGKKRNEWFEETFLPSFEAKMHHPKYPNQTILSDKQAEICRRYMDEEEVHTGYGWKTSYYKTVGGNRWYIYSQGRYTFLCRSFEPYRKHKGINGRIPMRRWDRIEDRKYFGESYMKICK